MDLPLPTEFQKRFLRAKAEYFHRCESADFRPVRFRCESEQVFEQVNISLICFHVAAEGTPHHPVRSEPVKHPARDDLQIFVWKWLLGAPPQARELHDYVG